MTPERQLEKAKEHLAGILRCDSQAYHQREALIILLTYFIQLEEWAKSRDVQP
jgi:hypothetical protein